MRPFSLGILRMALRVGLAPAKDLSQIKISILRAADQLPQNCRAAGPIAPTELINAPRKPQELMASQQDLHMKCTTPDGIGFTQAFSIDRVPTVVMPDDHLGMVLSLPAYRFCAGDGFCFPQQLGTMRLAQITDRSLRFQGELFVERLCLRR